MKLRSLALNQFRKFTGPTRLDGIGDGLNVVVGPNEMGKSTMLAALRAALFEKYSSKAQPIIALQNDRNKAAPVVEMTFELDDGLYRIAKRFIKKPYARLTCPDGRVLEGDAAEDRLQQLLGFDEPGKTGAKAESLGMWNVLWVEQGRSFGALDMPQSARSNLHNALDTEVGAVLGGRRGRSLPQAIERQLGELVTAKTGQPRNRYKDLIDRAAALRDEHEDLRSRRTELSRTLDELEETEAKLKRLSTGDRDEADRDELEDTRRRHARLSELQARIQAASSEWQLARRNLEHARQIREDRALLRESIKKENDAVAAARMRLEDVREQEKAARAERDSLQTQIRDREAAVAGADEAVSRQRRILAAVDRQSRIRQLEAQLENARAAEIRRQDAQQGAAAILATDDALTAIRDADAALQSVTSRLNAAATRISFDMTAEGQDGIEIDGKALVAGAQLVQAIQPTTIMIPGRGRITIEPAIKNRDELLFQQREAKEKLTKALELAGARTVEGAEAQHARRLKLLQEARMARQEAALHAPATDDHEAGAQALGDFIEGQRQVLTREAQELSLAALPARDAAEDALRTAQQDAQDGRAALETLRASLAGPEETLSRLQTELGTVSARHEDAQGRLKDLQKKLQEAEQSQSESDLDAAIAAAERAVLAKQTAVTDLEAQRTDETLAQLEARISRLEKAMEERRQKRETLNVAKSALKSRIEAAEGAGLDEAIAQNRRARQHVEDELCRVEREVAVLRLLLSTLRTAEQEAKERYLSPVLNRIRPYLQLLFPGADIRIDEELQVTGVVRQEGHEEAFHHLSMGTQEQIAILVRLAFAEMLVEQGHPATVILDDALVFSDDRRMKRMFDILTMAARNVQVIVLTCREQLFEDLGGQPLVLTSGNADDLMSA